MHKRAGRATRLGRARARLGLGAAITVAAPAPAPTFATRPSAMASKNPRQIEMVKRGTHGIGGSLVAGVVIMAHTPATKETSSDPSAGLSVMGADGQFMSVQRQAPRYAAMQNPLKRAKKSPCNEGGREASSPCNSGGSAIGSTVVRTCCCCTEAIPDAPDCVIGAGRSEARSVCEALTTIPWPPGIGPPGSFKKSSAIALLVSTTENTVHMLTRSPNIRHSISTDQSGANAAIAMACPMLVSRTAIVHSKLCSAISRAALPRCK